MILRCGKIDNTSISSAYLLWNPLRSKYAIHPRLKRMGVISSVRGGFHQGSRGNTSRRGRHWIGHAIGHWMTLTIWRRKRTRFHVGILEDKIKKGDEMNVDIEID